MRNFFTAFPIILTTLTACDTREPVSDDLPATGGFVEFECPGGYQCPPDPNSGCDANPWAIHAQNGLCTAECLDAGGSGTGGAPDEDVCLPGTECIPGAFACARRCETDADCVFGTPDAPWPAICHTYPTGDQVCSNPFTPLPGDDGGSGGA